MRMMAFHFLNFHSKTTKWDFVQSLLLLSGAAEPGGSGGVGPPLELEIYLVNFLKNCKKKGFLVSDPP